MTAGCILSFSLVAIVLSSCSTLTPEKPGQDIPRVHFEQYTVPLRSGERQTVLTGFLFDRSVADLAVVHIDQKRQRQLEIYSFRGTGWTRQLNARLRPQVEFVDLVRIAGRDHLITYEPGRLNWFDPISSKERLLVELKIDYKATDDHRIPQVDITRDLNEDGLDDLLVPDIDGFWVATQQRGGHFTKPVKLGPPEPFARHAISGLDLNRHAREKPRVYRDLGITAQTAPWYQGRVHQADYNLDGRSDLLFWNQDHFDVYHQNRRGRFEPVPTIARVNVPIDSDGVYTRMFYFSGKAVNEPYCTR